MHCHYGTSKIKFLLQSWALLVLLATQCLAANLDSQVLGEDGDGFGLAAALGANDLPQVSYFNENSNQLKLAKKISCGWEIVTVVVASTVSDTAIVIENGKTHIFYIDGDKHIVHVSPVNEVWQQEILSTDVTAEGQLSATLCQGTICLAFYDEQAKTIKFAKRATESWEIQSIDSSPNDVGMMNSLTVDIAGLPVIAYLDSTQLKPKVARLQEDNSWQIETIYYADANFGAFPTIVVDGQGFIHVLSGYVLSENLPVDRGIYYSKRVEGQWTTIELSRDYAGGPGAIFTKNDQLPTFVHRYRGYNSASFLFSELRISSFNNESLQWDDDHLGYRSLLADDNADYALLTALQDSQGNKLIFYQFKNNSTDSHYNWKAVGYHNSSDIYDSGVNCGTPEIIISSASSSFFSSDSESSAQQSSSTDELSSSSLSSEFSNSGSASESSSFSSLSSSYSVESVSSSISMSSSSEFSSSTDSSFSFVSSSYPRSSSFSSSSLFALSSSASSLPGAIIPDVDNDGLDDLTETVYQTDPLNPDTDSDNVIDGQEVLEGSNPLDRGSYNAVLGKKMCAEWNLSIAGSSNSLELINTAANPLRVVVSILNREGYIANKKTISLLGNSQQSILLNKLIKSTFGNYGQVCVNHNGLANDLEGRLIYSKKSSLVNKEYDFLLPLSLSSGISGEQVVPYNMTKLFGDGRYVENWLQLSNVGNVLVKGRLYFYKQNGQLLKSLSVRIPSGGRIDVSVHQLGQNIAGLIRWVPGQSNVPLIFRNIIYVYPLTDAKQRYLLASLFEGAVCSGELFTLPYDTRVGIVALEVSNGRKFLSNANLEIYSKKGNLLKALSLEWRPYARRSIIINSYAPNTIGQIQVKGLQRNSICPVISHYQVNEDNQVSKSFSFSPQQGLGDYLLTAYNISQGQEENLIVANTTDKARAIWLQLNGSVDSNLKDITPAVASKNIGPLFLAANSLYRLNLNKLDTDKLGVIKIRSSSKNKLAAWILHSKADEYIAPSAARGRYNQ